MSVETQKFARKPFIVDAVEVTDENLKDVAEWCGGDIRTQKERGGRDEDEHYIKVRVHRPLNDRQTKAFAGDWILYAGTGYKVYTARAFNNSFESAEIDLDRNSHAFLGEALRNEVVESTEALIESMKKVASSD